MLDLTKTTLPDTVTVDGKAYSINTDFRFWLKFNALIQKETLLQDFDFLYLDFDVPQNRQKGIQELLKFYSPKKTLPRMQNVDNSFIALDYEQDADLIYSAFYQQYKIDLLDENLRLHWHKFLALITCLKDTKLNDVMGYRAFQPSGKIDSEYNKDMLKLKATWEIIKEESLTEEEKQMIKNFDDLLNKRNH